MYVEYGSRDEQSCDKCGSVLDRQLFNKTVSFGNISTGTVTYDSSNDYSSVKGRIVKEIKEKKRELEEYKEDTLKVFDDMGEEEE